MKISFHGYNKQVSTIAWIIAIIILWELVPFILQFVFNDAAYMHKLPYFHDIFLTIIFNFGNLLYSSWITFTQAALGFVLGAVIGYILAMLMSLGKCAEKIIAPYLIIVQMLPVLALAPIIYSIVKNADAAKIILSCFITFFPVAINSFSGFRAIEQDKKDLMHIYGCNKVQMYRYLMIPASLAYFFSGLKLAAPMAITATILVEMLGSNKGIGIKILSSLYYGSEGIDIFWAAVLFSAILGMFSYYIVIIIEKLLVKEREADNEA